MLSNIVNAAIVAAIAMSLLGYGVSLEMSMLVGCIAGCFLALGDISSTLRKLG